MDKTTLVNQLADLPLLQDIPRDQIAWVADRGEVNTFKEGDWVFRSGDPIDHLTIILQGTAIFRMQQNGQYREIGKWTKGDISGALPYSRAQTGNAEGVAIEDSTIFALDKSHFRDLICECHEFTSLLVHQMTDRVRSSIRAAQQNEKLMALGKISGGLAHELNNPAAAIVRSSESLQKHLSSVPDNLKKIVSVDLSDEQIDFVNNMLFSQIENGINKSESLMHRTEREHELTDWLDDNGFGDCYMLSETLAEYGFCVDDLEEIREHTNNEVFQPAIEWIESVLTTEKMVGDQRSL